MKKLLFVLGTRPEALKLAPLIAAARQDKRFRVCVCFTGQHQEMAYQVFRLFKIRPDYDLKVMQPNQTLALLSERLLHALNQTLIKEKPDVVIVQGDTTSAFVGALAAYYHQVPVAHVEAGLRSFDKYQPFPEEINRAMVGRIADFHFAPTRGAVKNLLREGIPSGQIFMTGNTIVDALKSVQRRLRPEQLPIVRAVRKRKRRIILATTHRRENFGKPLESICRAFTNLIRHHEDCELLLLVHKNPRVQETVHRHLGGNARIHLLPPADYLEFLELMMAADLIISDSGGVQEEAPSFQKPVLVLRNVTERPEGVAMGVAKLVGANAVKIEKEANRLLQSAAARKKMVSRINPYGSGRASQAILRILARKL